MTEGVTHSYLPVLAHHMVWEGRGSRLREVATVVLRCLQQTLCRTVLTGRKEEGGREEEREGERGREEEGGREEERKVVRLVSCALDTIVWGQPPS